ncbi:UPF0481 protein At3g47200-like [Aristolochia californica]|uniref:UPF0481 protein At3g47200-like n=1 Tax=Aristolochia californica TaxID=171875 RepID=UPI0035E1C29C
MAELVSPDKLKGGGALTIKIADTERSSEKIAKEASSPIRKFIEEIEGKDEEKLLSVVKEDLDELKAASDDSIETGTIFRVPDVMRGEEGDLFMPSYVPVSAYYPDIAKHIFDDLRHDYYFFYLNSILERNTSKILDDYMEMMKEQKQAIRDCYALKEAEELDAKRLICLLINCCYIVHLFLTFSDRLKESEKDELPDHLGAHAVWVDLLLVENQIPFFILFKVFQMAVGGDYYHKQRFEHLCLSYFKQYVELNSDTPSKHPDFYHHLLHMVHHHLIPSSSPNHSNHSKESRHRIRRRFSHFKKMGSFSRWSQLPISNPSFFLRTIPTATRLQEAGIKLRKRVKEGTGFSEAIFHRGILEISALHITESTKALLRNLIAWEQLCRFDETYFTCYGILMDNIIDTTDDVELLQKSGIIDHKLGSREMVTMIFNGFSRSTVFIGSENNFLPTIRKEIHDYFNNSFKVHWYRQWRKLQRDYFGSPWTVISLIAAMSLLALTMIQTYCAVHPR